MNILNNTNNSTRFWHQWINLQLKHNLNRITDLSIKNFHFEGFNYICFEFAPHQTIRLYIIDPEVQPVDIKELNIHNHLYDSQLLVLHGSIVNTVYKLDNTSEEFNMYSLVSALHPDNVDRKIKLEFLGKRGLIEHRRIKLLPGEFHFQPHTEIHGVQNQPSAYVSFMVFEFETAKVTSTIFTRESYINTIPTPNAYLKYTKAEVHGLLTDLLKRMESNL